MVMTNSSAIPKRIGNNIMGEIQAITATKISANGISIRPVNVAEVVKSLKNSNDLRLAAKEPTDAGLCSSRYPGSFPECWPTARCQSAGGIIQKAASGDAKTEVGNQGNQDPNSGTQSVSFAALGTTRSHIHRKDRHTRASKLTKKEANRTSR